MARTFDKGDKNKTLHYSFGGEEDDPTSDSDSELLGDQGLEALLDSAFETDQVLRRILDEGLTQIIRGAIRLFNLQRGRDAGQPRGDKKSTVSSSPCCRGEEDNPTLNPDHLGEGKEEDLDAFLDSSLENDSVLRRILDEGMTQIIRGAIRLFNLQRQRDKGQAQGHSESEKRPAPKSHKNVTNFDDWSQNSVDFAGQGSSFKGSDDNPPIGTGTTVITSEEGEEALKDNDPTDNGIHLVPVEDGKESTISEGGLNLEDGINMAASGNGKRRKKGPFKHSCYFCQKTFPTPSSLERHLSTHTQEKPFPCTLCGKEFAEKGNLDRHIRRHGEETPFICNLCGKGVTSKQSLEDHIRRHLKEKWFKCPHMGCTSSFVTGEELKSHARVHSGEKPFACPHPRCGKAFSQKSTLTSHSRIHSGVKQFICNLCGKGVPTKQSLENHIRRHEDENENEKPLNFKCPHPGCTSSFVNSGNLQRHAKVHSGEKPFLCPYPNCGKRFTTKYGRDEHHRVHTGEKPFVCGCGKKYAAYAILYRHRRRCTEGDRSTKKRKICKDAE